MKHQKGQDIHGWLIIDKPAGLGSTDIVNTTRRLFTAKKNGHAGTLDPFATGVLPIAFGEATKLLPFVTDGDKEYEFTLKFGITTDTLDLTGNITASEGRLPSTTEIQNILPQFIAVADICMKLAKLKKIALNPSTISKKKSNFYVQTQRLFFLKIWE